MQQYLIALKTLVTCAVLGQHVVTGDFCSVQSGGIAGVLLTRVMSFKPLAFK